MFRFLAMTVLAAAAAPMALAQGTPAAQTIYVAATGDGGNGSADAPFALKAGREYDLNRLIRQAADAGHDVEVVFNSGTYHDVRLQILKQGVGTDSIYLLEPGPSGDGHRTMVAGKTYHFHSYARCNEQGNNCRVEPADFALGPNSSVKLTLRSAKPNQAVFDGATFASDNPDIDSNALVVGGAYFGVVQNGQQDVKSEPIKNVMVSGLVFRNYRNGILVQHGQGITIDSCVVDNIGTHRTAGKLDDQNVGVSGFSANGDSQLVLVKNTTIHNVWNVEGSTKNSDAWPGLMHSIYDGDSGDVIFLNNTLSGSSGPMIKFGYYPVARNGRIIHEYGSETWRRRGFFIGNELTLAPISDAGRVVPPYKAIQAFIHDNSQEKIGNEVTPPAKGMVFLNNTFRNALGGGDALPVAFVRQELPAAGMNVDLPDFFFAGNRIDGIGAASLLVHRIRGTAVAAGSIQRDNGDGGKSPLASLTTQNDGAVDVGQTVERLLGGPLRSPDTNRDKLVAEVIRTGEMPRVP